MGSSPIQGTTGGPDQVTATLLQSRSGQEIEAAGISQQAVIDIVARRELHEIKAILTAMLGHFEILTGEVIPADAN